MTAEDDRAALVGINHVALEVGDVDEALEWYGSLFRFELRSRSATMAFLDMGDQFIAMSESAGDGVDEGRHVGLVVDDPEAALDRLEDVGGEPLPTGRSDIRDPWGNRLQLVAYRDIQYTKTEHVLGGMDVDRERLEKTASALAELDRKGMAPEDP